jgi:DNA-binding transcriptional LysR family regulator
VVPFARLADKTLLLPSARHGLRAIVERCAAEAGITLRVEIESDSLYTLKDLVRHGYGTTVLPLVPIHEDIAAKRLSAAPLTEPTPSRRLVLSFASDRPASRAARFASEAIKSVVTELVERGVWTGHLVDEAHPT